VVVDEQRLAVGGNGALLLVVLDVPGWVVEDREAPGSVEVDSDGEAAESARWKGGVHGDREGSGQWLIGAGRTPEGQRANEHCGDA
jgi:hypothetical protein